MGLFDRFRAAGQGAEEGKNKAATAEEGATRLIEEGQLLEAGNRIEEALQRYLEAIRLAPNLARAHLNHGNALLAKGDLQGALEAFTTAIKYKPDYAGAYYNIGNALVGNRQYDEAVTNYRKALEIKPDYAEVHCALGVALKELGQLDDAVASYKRALAFNPDLVEAHSNLGLAVNDLYHRGNALANKGQREKAVESYRQVLEIKPDFAEAMCNMGLALQELGQAQEAVAILRRALLINPDLVEAHFNLGVVLQALGQFEEAAACYRRVLEINPDFADAYSNLGILLQEIGQLEGAMACFRHELQVKPDSFNAHSNLGLALQGLGQLDGALASYRRALEIKPDFHLAHSNLLFALNYSASHTLLSCLEQARQYGRIVAAKASGRFTAWECAPRPDRLRVGLVSGDLRNHPAGYFLEGMLSHIDPARIELIAYPTNHKEDELTARIRPCFSAWKSLVGKSDEAAAHLIHADGVHVLLDLSGHTAHNRLPVFAWKPAPVQAMWLGYFATTGLAEMDYILGDKWLLPDGEEHHFVEKGWRLPGIHACLTPPEDDIKVEDLPALRNPTITFGTLNNLAKMNDRVVACWARILNAIPNSRLYLNTNNLRNESLRKSIIERYAAHGIAESRLILEATNGRAAALNSYNRIDIALDPFPYPGGTTSFEALWMGVPVLTMRGSSYISHLGECIMHNAGLPDWIAANEEDYVAKAVAFSTNLADLAKLRCGLRAQVLASPLFDVRRFARNFEDALWGMWQAYQAKQGKDN